MLIPMIVMASSWLLNALMDAIDHGKGGLTLNLLWHILKWFSYAIPFGYIMYLVGMPIRVIIPFVLFLWVMWETIYRYLRYIDFWKWDKF